MAFSLNDLWVRLMLAAGFPGLAGLGRPGPRNRVRHDRLPDDHPHVAKLRARAEAKRRRRALRNIQNAKGQSR